MALLRVYYAQPPIGFHFAAPNFAPSSLKAVSTTSTSMTITWEAPSLPPDADGYVFYYYQTDNGLFMVEKVADGDVTNYTMGGLTPNTSYTISMRAYQDILGPASGVISVMTNTTEGTLQGREISAINKFLRFLQLWSNHENKIRKI